MALPIVFLLGLLVVVTHHAVGLTLPGEAALRDVPSLALVLALPTSLALFAYLSLCSEFATGRRSFVPPRALLRLSAMGTPLALLAWCQFAAYDDLVTSLAPGSYGARTLLTLLPLYIVELSRLPLATMAGALLVVQGNSMPLAVRPPALLPQWREILPIVRLQYGWPLLALMPAVVFGFGMDVLATSREALVFVIATSLGTALGTAALVVLLAITLPFWFRVAFGARRLSGPMAAQLSAAAERLGFKASRVMQLPTGGRVVNAMMVGPLPIGRHLFLTDGLLQLLDAHAVTGVLAHEIGHARLGHPGRLVVLALSLGALLTMPLHLLDTDVLEPPLLVVVTALSASVVWLVVRTVAHRFEHEADVDSVRQLGAGPCSRALEAVAGDGSPLPRSLWSRVFTLHPDETQRRVVMRDYELDEAFRARFEAGGRALRRALLGMVAVAGLALAWIWTAEWPFERVVLRYYLGDLDGARDALRDLPQVPPRWQEAVRHLEDEIGAGMELAAAAGPAHKESMPLLATKAWLRGERELLDAGPAAARRWFALALMAMESPSRTELAVTEYCAAAEDGDPERMALLAEIVRRLGVPSALESVFVLPQ